MSEGAREHAFVVAVAVLVAMAAGSVMVIGFGEDPARVYRVLVARTLGDGHGVGQVLFRATPLMFTGLAVAVAFRVGLFNIGAEGQMTAGALATALVGAALPSGTPWIVAVPLAVGAGAAAGAALGAIPGLLKVRFGAHEVINTIMLNFLVSGFVLWLGRRWVFVSETTHTEAIVAGAQVPSLGLAGSAANASVVLAVGMAVVVWVFFRRTTVGFAWRVIGHSPTVAEAAGVRVGAAVVGAMAVSGGIAGLVGVHAVLGYKHYYELGVGHGAGFMGIAVALLGRNHPWGVVGAALVFGALAQGGFAIHGLVPKEVVDVLQATIILAVVATTGALRGGERRQ